MGADLNGMEGKEAKSLLLPPTPAEDTPAEFVSNVEKEVNKRKRMRSQSTKSYMDTTWIPATSSEVERLFSRAKLIRTAHRTKLDLENFESLLYLFYNRTFWSKETVARAVVSAKST